MPIIKHRDALLSILATIVTNADPRSGIGSINITFYSEDGVELASMYLPNALAHIAEDLYFSLSGEDITEAAYLSAEVV